MSLRLYGLGFSCLLVLPACGGGGGSGGPVNPAPAPPAAALTIDMEGFWECTESTLVETDTVDTDPFPVGDEIALESHRLLAVIDATGPSSVLRADLELEARDLGGRLDWYVNQADGRTLGFAFGVTGPGGNAQYGLRLAVVDPATLVGFEALTRQLQSVSRTKWVYQLTFRRTVQSESELAVSLTERETDSVRQFLGSKLERIPEEGDNRQRDR